MSTKRPTEELPVPHKNSGRGVQSTSSSHLSLATSPSIHCSYDLPHFLHRQKWLGISLLNAEKALLTKSNIGV